MLDKKLTIFAYAEGRTTVTITNGVERSTTGFSLTETIAAMHPDDRKVLAAFCQASLEEMKLALTE